MVVFQLFTVDTVQTIMTHELGHSLVGLQFTNPEDPYHSNDPDQHNVSNELKDANYSYCLLS